MATTLNSHFEKAIKATSRNVLLRLSEAAVSLFSNAAVSNYGHHCQAIHDLCDGLWDICNENIEKYMGNPIENSMTFHEIISGLPQWIEIEAHRIGLDAPDRNEVMAYLVKSVTKLLEELDQSFKNIYNNVYSDIATLLVDQLRSFFIADLLTPAVHDIAGCVYEYKLICYGKKATEWAVLNALEKINNESTDTDAASLSDDIKMQVAYSWGFVCSSDPNITDEQNQKICVTLNLLFQSYKEIAGKYGLKTDKFIDLVREKQLRNEFVHFNETIRDYKHKRRYGNFLEGFLALQENQSLQKALHDRDEVRLLPEMFQCCREHLQLSNACKFSPGDSIMVKPLGNSNGDWRKERRDPYPAVFIREVELGTCKILRNSTRTYECVNRKNIYHN